MVPAIHASGKILQRIVARPNISGVPSTPGESGATLGKHRGQGFPSSVTPCGVPPSPEGKASSGGGMIPAPYYWRGLQYQPFQGFFQLFLVYAGIIDDQAVQVCGLGIEGAEGLDLQALGEEGLGQGFVR